MYSLLLALLGFKYLGCSNERQHLSKVFSNPDQCMMDRYSNCVESSSLTRFKCGENNLNNFNVFFWDRNVEEHIWVNQIFNSTVAQVIQSPKLSLWSIFVLSFQIAHTEYKFQRVRIVIVHKIVCDFSSLLIFIPETSWFVLTSCSTLFR